MDATNSRRRVCPPYLALKHVESSEDGRPVLLSISEKKTISDDSGVLTSSSISSWATPQGWTLVRDASSSSTYLLDPHDLSRRIPLPHLPPDNLPTHCSCLLSDYPAADPAHHQPDCLVLLVQHDAPVLWYCSIGGDGGGGWVRHDYDIGTLEVPADMGLGEGFSEKLVIRYIAACRGRFYFNGIFNEVGVLEFCPAPAFSAMAIRDAIPQPFGFHQAFMVEAGQELYMVSLLSGCSLDVVHRFHVHRMDLPARQWREVDDIGGRVFLLSPWYFGASRSADECGLERNCIYMPNPRRKCLTIFNVRDGTQKVQDLDEAPVFGQALWMLPTHP